MKLITLNSHSLIEENYEEKFHRFIQGILTERLPLLHPCPPGQPRPSLRERAGPSWISRTLDMDFR